MKSEIWSLSSNDKPNKCTTYREEAKHILIDNCLCCSLNIHQWWIQDFAQAMSHCGK